MSAQSTSAIIRYIIPGDEKPVYVASQGGTDAQLEINVDYDNREVVINDARELEQSANLDREGFCLQAHRTAITDFYHLDNSKAAYEAELKQLVLPVVNGDDLLVFDHTLRSNSADIRGVRQTRETASIIHNDYTPKSARVRLRDLLSDEEAEHRLKNRFAIINVWRTISAPVFQFPLTCCDAQTIDEEDVIAVERRAVDRIGELELVRFNPAHRWYYYPAMDKDEVLLIKTFDSEQDGRASRSIHTAFNNPLASPDAPPRESIESRMLVFF
jgi:hypothetical protein